MRLYLRLGGDGRVAAATFQVYGCPAAIAAGSVLTELVVGRGPEGLKELGREALETALGGLSGEDLHAAALGADAVRAARAAFPRARKGP